jgi:quercetin dioxygenase-like cupin family protein
MMRTTIGTILVAASAALCGAPASAHDTGPGHEKLTMLQERPLPEMAGQRAIMLTVQYAPGQVSVPHKHPGSVFAYVLDGAVTSQLEGEAPVTYKAGDSWYEPPEAGHIVSRNASQTKPATLLVWLVAPEGRPVVNPIPQGKK